METLDDAIVVRHHFHERLTIAVVVEPKIDRGFDRTAKGRVVEDRSETGDDTTIDEALDPRPRRIWTQSDRSTDFTMGHPGIVLKIAEYLSVYRIYHSGNHRIKG
jgi:hypothetical protein